MSKTSWKVGRDLLFRGDSSSILSLPVPDANKSIVRHILYLEGQGRTTPYLSASESRETAKRFAGKNGSIFSGDPSKWKSIPVAHRSRKELLQLLKGKGKGDAVWHSAFEVLQASKYVEEHLEHLADFRDIGGDNAAAIRDAANKALSQD